jgi:Region found in RelA / SpoT proteins
MPFIETDDDNWMLAYKIIDNWRAAHGYPLNTFQSTLRRKLRNYPGRSIAAQRLKRLPSIYMKLMLAPGMNLARMQDIVGLRAVVPSVSQAHRLRNDYLSTRFTHELRNEYDYIENPKKSGYRSIHLVYKYHNPQKPEYNNLQVELQIRTRVQHSWAMAVETMGVFLQSSLKSGIGPDEWKTFFTICSSAFSKLEGTPVVAEHQSVHKRELFRAVRKQAKILGVQQHLQSLSSVVDIVGGDKNTSGYILLELNLQAKSTSIHSYSRDDLLRATDDYSKIESTTRDDPDRNVVLVSAGSLTNLKRAYPSYFLDTGDFLVNLNKVISKT